MRQYAQHLAIRVKFWHLSLLVDWDCKSFAELMSYKNQTKFSADGFKHVFIKI